MKRICLFHLTLLFVASLLLSNGSLAQDYVYYKTLVYTVNYANRTGYINSISFSPDGQMLACGNREKTIHLWDISTGQHMKKLTGHTSSVLSVSFSPDGQTIASAGWDKTIRLWDVGMGWDKEILTGHTDIINSISFSPHGRSLASGGDDKTIRLWDVVSGRHKKTLTGHTDVITSVSFSPDGQTLASGSRDNTVRLWDVVSGRHKKTLIGHTSMIESVSFSPDGQTLASGSWDSTIRLWDAGTNKHKKTLNVRNALIDSLSFSPDGQTIVVGSGFLGQTIHLLDADIGELKDILRTDRNGASHVAFSPDGKIIAGVLGTNTIGLWRISSAQSTDSSPEPTAEQVYNNAIRSVMWIVNPGIGEGSGVLIDKKFKLAITNAHVTDKRTTIDVYFPAPDEKGELIKNRNFYLTNSGVLKMLGYYTKGRVVAKNEDADLAVIRLDGLPETAREIDWNFTTPATSPGDLVYILGNPGRQDLWRWTLGEFLSDRGNFLHIQSDVFGGNSGGPVLNKQGILIGIIARSDRHMNTAAIPVRYVNQLFSASQLKRSQPHK